jgi:hypothetical protein
MDDLIEALQILKKYQKTQHDKNYPTQCQHDILLVVGVERLLDNADMVRLEELGFYWSDQYDCWSSFRFGSC